MGSLKARPLSGLPGADDDGSFACERSDGKLHENTSLS
jgi:hypothetical protein